MPESRLLTRLTQLDGEIRRAKVELEDRAADVITAKDRLEMLEIYFSELMKRKKEEDKCQK